MISKAGLKSRACQRGMATTLVMLLTGMAMTVTAMGMVYGIRSAQDQQMASHAAVPAESKAWEGVELVRLYLLDIASQTQGEDRLVALTGNLASNINGLTISVSEPYVKATGLIGFNISSAAGNNGAAGATATLQVFYNVKFASAAGAGVITQSDIIKIGKPLNLTGSITFKGNPNAKISVKGDANLSGSVTGLQYLQASGDIVIGGGIQVDELFANGTLTLNGSASTQKGSALGNITLASGGTQGTLYTNGDISITNGSVGSANALGKITTSTGGTLGTLNAGKTIAISNGTITEANAVGDVTVTSWPSINRINSKANVTCPSPYWFPQGTIKAQSTSGCPNTTAVVAPTSVTVTLFTPLTAKLEDTAKVDAYDFKDASNYVFEYVNGKRQVTVQNINGMTNGIYYLGNYPQQNGRGYNDFLCKNVDSSNNCTLPAAPDSTTRTLCQGQSTYNGCITYANGTWTVSGKNLAPGALWFKGNVQMSNGEYYNTVIATGNITTSGAHVLYAVNYAGYKVICTNKFLNNSTNDFAGMYPTNFCDTAGAKLISNALGNVGYLDGSFTNGVFSGGAITLGASSVVYGSIVAGDVFLTEGSSTVHGYVTAAAQGATPANAWGGSTLIDLSNLPDTYVPGQIPSGGQSTCTTNCTGSTGTTVAVKWTRYL